MSVSAAVIDSTSVPVITDSLAAALDEALAADTTAVKKERDRGYDASKYMMMKRFQPIDEIEFTSSGFFDNTFITLRETSLKLASPDYTFGLLSGISIGKWYHEDHAVRINASLGRWADNFNGNHIWGGELSASYLFNLTSYLGGYRPERFCNLSVVAGAGAAVSGYEGNIGFALTAHAGVNVAMKLSRSVDFFIEPLAAVYSNGMAVSRAGNWRSWLGAFNGTLGLNFTMGTPKVELSPKRWFMSMSAGPHIQNAENVYDDLGFLKGLGVHVGLGIGHYVTDYMALRGTFSYSRNKWVVYDGEPCFSNYFAIRIEGMLDIVNLISKKDNHLVSASLVVGPELGYMHKDDYKDIEWKVPYIGLTGGVQVKFNLTERVRVFVEPRCSFVPYNAPSNDRTTLNDYLNYYDGLMNLNFGLEFDL